MKRLIIIICSIFLLVSLIKEVKGFNEEKFKKAFKEVLEDFCKEEEMCENLSLHEELEIGRHGFDLLYFDLIYRYSSCLEKKFNGVTKDSIRSWFINNINFKNGSFFEFDEVSSESLKKTLKEVIPEEEGMYFIYSVVYVQFKEHVMFSLTALEGKDFQNSRYSIIFYNNIDLNCHDWRIIHSM